MFRMSNVLLDAHVAAAFGVEREVKALPGTEGRTYRAGNVVLRRGVEDTALLWKIGVLRHIQGDGFRVERPIPTRDDRWVVDGWTAWTFLEGRSATPADAAVVSRGTQALHEALASIAYARHLTDEAGPADREAWGDDPLPTQQPAQIDTSLRKLAALRRPVTGLHDQVIHGDLNYHNILIVPGQAPGFIDFSPYWRPPEFAAAIAAYWLGPYQGDTAVLHHFAQVRKLEQMLVRVAIRQLARLVEAGGLEYAEEFTQAANVVCDLIDRPPSVRASSHNG
jgi:uncharacterized protein (TIGR02569 family)